MPDLPPFEFEEITFADLHRRMESGEHTARSVTERYLERIEALNERGPELRAVLETNPDVLGIADTLDAERKSSGPRGPLHGIPILLKDNIGTHDRMTTTAGSLALAGSIAPRDAFVAKRLREAGAILLGKANMSEWANFRSPKSISGWSGRGGQCRNPYILELNPSGSSSGSAVAVAANLCPAALGTETNGSIISPASVNSVVGIKPTVGLVSRSTIIPISASQDVAGPMARTVEDAAILLGALTGVDLDDPATAGSAGNHPSDYAPFLDPDGLRGARIGVEREVGYDEKVLTTLDAAVEVLRDLGAVVLDPVSVAGPKTPEWDILLYEFKDGLNAYFKSLGPDAPVRSLEELIAFNDAHQVEEMPLFGQENLILAQEKGPLDGPEFQKIYADYLRDRAAGIDRAMEEHRLDAVLSRPCGGPPATAGYPNVTVPAGYLSGVPVGICFFGKPYSEPNLIKYAFAYEWATRHRRPPQCLPNFPES